MDKDKFDRVNFERLYGIAVQVLNVLAENKCSVAEIERILDAVNAKAKSAATLPERGFFGRFHQF